MKRFLVLLLAIFGTEPALAQLDSWATWTAAQPNTSRQIPPAALVARGIGTDTYYVLEVDETTGGLPVSGTFTPTYADSPGGAPPSDAAYVAGTDGAALRGLKTDASGELQVDVLSSALPSGAATSAKQDTAAALLTTIDADTGTIAGAVSGSEMQVDVVTSALPTGAATAAKQPALGVAGTASADVITVQGIASMTALSTTSTNLPATVATDSGVANASTLRAALATRHESASTPISVRISDGSAFSTPAGAGRSYADSARNAYASSAVTTGAWVQLIASTAATINGITVFDSCGETLELGTGAAAAESRKLLIPPGGIDGVVPLAIASGTRVSVRAVSGNCSSGELVITGLN